MNIAIRRFALVAGMLVAGASFAATNTAPAQTPSQGKQATVLAQATGGSTTKAEAKKCHDAAGKEVKCPKKKAG